MTGSKRRGTHIARRGRSMGATVGGRDAAPLQSRKQASAGSTRDAWFATASRVSRWRADGCFTPAMSKPRRSRPSGSARYCFSTRRPTPRARIDRRGSAIRVSGSRRAITGIASCPPLLCQGSDSQVDCVVVMLATTELCAPHNRRLLRDDRRLAGRASLNGRSAVWRSGFGESAEGWTRSPITSENAERCVAAGSGRQLRREGPGRRRATRARRFGVLRCLDVPRVSSTELGQRRNTT
jgi:hypothetical protein